MKSIIPYSRIFARELQQTNLIKNQQKDGTIELITPSGECITHIYWCGALTEIHISHETVQAIRIADPTGGLILNIGWRDQEIQDVIKRLKPPLFIAVFAKTHIKGAKSELPFSLIPFHLMPIDRKIRDQWIIETAHLMVDRLTLLRDYRGGNTEIKDCITYAAVHYHINSQELQDLCNLTNQALSCVVDTEPLPDPIDSSPGNTDKIILTLIRDNSGSRGIPVSDLVILAHDENIPEDIVIAMIRTLIANDDIYQPSAGFVKLL